MCVKGSASVLLVCSLLLVGCVGNVSTEQSDQITPPLLLDPEHTDSKGSRSENDNAVCVSLEKQLSSLIGKNLFHEGRLVLKGSEFRRPAWHDIDLERNSLSLRPQTSFSKPLQPDEELTLKETAAHWRKNGYVVLQEADYDFDRDGVADSIRMLRRIDGWVTIPKIMFVRRPNSDKPEIHRGFFGDIIIYKEAPYLLQIYSDQLRVLRPQEFERAEEVCSVKLGRRIGLYSSELAPPEHAGSDENIRPKTVTFLNSHRYQINYQYDVSYPVNANNVDAKVCRALAELGTNMMSYGLKLDVSQFPDETQNLLKVPDWVSVSYGAALDDLKANSRGKPENIKSFAQFLKDPELREEILRGDYVLKRTVDLSSSSFSGEEDGEPQFPTIWYSSVRANGGFSSPSAKLWAETREGGYLSLSGQVFRSGRQHYLFNDGLYHLSLIHI